MSRGFSECMYIHTRYNSRCRVHSALFHACYRSFLLDGSEPGFAIEAKHSGVLLPTAFLWCLSNHHGKHGGRDSPTNRAAPHLRSAIPEINKVRIGVAEVHRTRPCANLRHSDDERDQIMVTHFGSSACDKTRTFDEERELPGFLVRGFVYGGNRIRPTLFQGWQTSK